MNATNETIVTFATIDETIMQAEEALEDINLQINTRGSASPLTIKQTKDMCKKLRSFQETINDSRTKERLETFFEYLDEIVWMHNINELTFL